VNPFLFHDAHQHARWIRRTVEESHLADFLSEQATASIVAALARAVVAFHRSPQQQRREPRSLLVPVMRALLDHPLGGVLTGSWRHQVAEAVVCGYRAAADLDRTG
jgi:hypothetical protein